MKRITALISAFAFALICLALPVSAATLQDGVYEVPVELWHKEDNKLSTGNDYIHSVAKLEVENGKHTLTIVLPETMDDMVFWYYLDGSVSGETAEAKEVSDVTVDGKTYEQGFSFPLVKTSGEVGLKFKVPAMAWLGMNPSAKLKIDYSSVKIISQKVSATSAVTTTKAPDVTEKTVEESISETTTTEASTQAQSTQPETLASTSVLESTSASEAAAVQENVAETETDSPKYIWIIVGVAVVAVIVVAVIIIKKKH